MARDIGDLIVRLSLDSAKFDDGMKRLEKQVSTIQKEFKSSTTGLTDFGKVTDKLKSSADTLSERLGAQKKRVQELEGAYEKSKSAKGEDAEETQRLAVKLEEARGKMGTTEKALEQLNSQIKLNENGWYQFGTNLQGAGEKLQKVGEKMSSAGKTLSVGVTAPIVALGTTALKAGIEFESAFAGVKKTIEATPEQFDALSNSIKEMSERIPATTTELAGVMEMAGQLGVQGHEHLTKFTETITALGVSTNLTQEDAATMLAQFSNITKMDMGNIDKLGSVIVELGNNFATTEADIVAMGQRLAAAGNELGMSEAQIMAFSAALSSVGIEAEAGGSAFSKLMINMKVAAETGTEGNAVIEKTGKTLRELEMMASHNGKSFKALAEKLGLTTDELKGYMTSAKDLDSFAKASGQTADEFAKAYGEDAAGALITFLEGLNKLEAEGGSAIVMLDEMGITEVRLRDSILRAAGATDLFTDAQEKASAAWEDNTALQNEANQRYATTESQIIMLKNAASNLAIEFADVMMPTFTKVLESLRGLVDWFRNLSEGQKETIVKVAAVAAAVGPLLVVFGKVATGIGAVMKVLGPLFTAMGGASGATGALGAAFTALTGPIGIVIAAIAAVAAVFVTLYKTNEEFRDKVNAVWDKIKAAFENVKEVFRGTFEKMKSYIEPVKESLTRLWESVKGVFEKLWKLLEPIITAIGVAIGGLVAIIVGVANGILAAVGPIVDALVNCFDGVVNIISAVVSLMQGDFAGAWESIKAAFGAFSEMLSSIWEGIKNFFQGFWEALVAIAEGFGVDLGDFFVNLWTSIKEGVVSAWEGIKSWLSSAWETTKSVASSVWGGLSSFFTDLWAGIKEAASVAWGSITSTISGLVETGKIAITTAWESVKTAVLAAWENLKTAASTTWDAICSAVSTAVTGAKSKIETAWTTITTAISTVWTNLKNTVSSVWTGITGAIKSAVDSGKSSITSAWESVKTAVKTTWDKVLGIVKSPIESAQTWIQEKVEYFKGLFNFTWKLPEFKLPKVNVTWKEIGLGIKLPSFSIQWNKLGAIFKKPTIFDTNAGLQGVGEAGPEAVLPLSALWKEMDGRLRRSMQDILSEHDAGSDPSLVTAIREGITELIRGTQSNQHADQTSARAGDVYLQVDGKTFARLILPYLDGEQAAAFERNIRLAGI